MERLFNLHPRLTKFYYAHRQTILLGLLWLLAVLLVDPRGEFPLNDDWAFARPVKTLCDEGRLALTEWPVMSLIAHIGWGWLVSSIFGFSFTVLRLSVVVLGFIAILLVRRTLRELGAGEEQAMLGALAVGFNAIYFNLSFTFMTDVPFFLCELLSMYYFLRALRGGELRGIALGALAACVATLIRQVGLFLPLGYALAVIFKERCALKAWVRGIGPVIFVYGALIAYERWMEVTIGLPAVYRTYEDEVWQKITAGPLALISNTADCLMVCLIYLGLFMFPLLVIWLPRRSRPDKIITAALALAGLALTFWLSAHDRLMPLLERGIFIDFALGPPTLRDVFHLHRENLYRVPRFMLWFITCLGCVGAFWLLRHSLAAVREGLFWLFRGRGDAFRAGAQVFGIGTAVIILLPLAIKLPFDRYLLACVPGLLIGVAVSGATGSSAARWQSWAAALFIMGSALFAVAGTHDYLAWNRARWQAVDWLCQEHKIPHSRIDGGFEFGGWHLYDPDYEGDGIKTWWWINDDEFTITFGLIEDHHVTMTFPYIRWCPPTRDFVAVLERRDVHADHIDLATTLRHAGRNVKTRAGNIVRCWDAGTKKWPVMVAFGCYVKLEPGRYLARFKLATGKPDSADEKGRGLLRVVEFANGPALAESLIAARSGSLEKYAYQDLPFTVSTNRRVEVQVAGGNVPLWLDKVEFLRTGD